MLRILTTYLNCIDAWVKLMEKENLKFGRKMNRYTNVDDISMKVSPMKMTLKSVHVNNSPLVFEVQAHKVEDIMLYEPAEQSCMQVVNQVLQCEMKEHGRIERKSISSAQHKGFYNV